MHKSCAFSRSLSLYVGKLTKESKNSVLSLQKFLLRDKWFHLFINLWSFSKNNIYAWSSVGNNKIFFDVRRMQKLALALMRKNLLASFMPPPPICAAFGQLWSHNKIFIHWKIFLKLNCLLCDFFLAKSLGGGGCDHRQKTHFGMHSK